MQRYAAMVVLWFAMSWFAWEIVASVVDAPRGIGPILATMVTAGAVTWVRNRVVGRAATTVSSSPALGTAFRPAD